MAKKQGRKSTVGESVEPDLPAPDDLGSKAKALWHSNISDRPSGFFTAADLGLLREYCRIMETDIPKLRQQMGKKTADPKLYDAYDKMVRLSTSLARSLRLCVSSRTRPDTASMRDSVSKSTRPPGFIKPPWAKI